MRISLLLVFGLWGWSVPCASQTAPLRPAPSVLFGAVRQAPRPITFPEERRDSLPHLRSTYWKEGAVIGGGSGAFAGALLGYSLCGLSEDLHHKSCIGSGLLGGVLGAAVLAIPGALIGGQFPKRRPGEEGRY